MATTYDPTTADLGTITPVPAGTVVIDPNVRKDIRLDKSFISSIRVRGFEQYPVGYAENDQVHVTIGQRRVSAALEIGWPVIPIVVKTKVDAENDRAEELRLLSQLAENEQRAPLTERESADGYKQLALLGVTEDQIARKTNQPKARVVTALAVAKSDAALTELDTRQLTLDQAAIFVEFEDDPAAITELDQLAQQRPEQLEHAAARLREKHAARAEADKRAAALAAEGWTVIREESEYFTPPKNLQTLSALWRADDPKQTRLTEETAIAYNDRTAIVYIGYRGAGARLYIGNFIEQGLTTYAYDMPKGPLSDKEKTERRQKRQDKAEMRAATLVRREWLATTLLFLGRKIDQASALQWIALTSIKAPGILVPSGSDAGRHLKLAAELLHLEFQDRHGEVRGDYIWLGTVQLEAQITDHKDALRVALAVAIASTEAVVGNEKGDAFGRDPRAARYLQQLEQWGYTLSDVEQRMVKAGTSKGAKK